jgi:hypothetical protein
MFNLVQPISTIETIISRMRYTNSVSSIVASGSNWRFTTASNTGLVVGEYITIGAGSHKIINLPTSTSVIVDGIKPVGSSWIAQAPFFYHGTPDKIDPDRLKDMRGNEMKYPFICLFEPITSDVTMSGSVAETCELWLVFMTTANNRNTTDEHHTIINEMCALMQRFITACEESGDLVNVPEDLNFRMIRHAQYGLVAKTQGHDKYFLKDNLSGVEIENFKLEIYKKHC